MTDGVSAIAYRQCTDSRRHDVTESPRDDDEQRVEALVDELLDKYPPSPPTQTTFLGAQFDRGPGVGPLPGGPRRPRRHPKLQKIINERVFAAGAPNAGHRNPIGYGMCGPTIVVWGSDEQKQRYLRPLFTGEEIWCQLFSEPGAGSDFAGLSHAASRTATSGSCNGQKVWTTLAHLARWGLLVVRTDPEAVKHAGHHRVRRRHARAGGRGPPAAPDDRRGRVQRGVLHRRPRSPTARCSASRGDGWRVSLTTLMNERVSIGGAIPQQRLGRRSPDLVKTWQDLPERPQGPATLDEVMQLWIRAEVLRLTNIRANQNRKMGDPGPGGLDRQAGVGRPEQGHLRQVIDLLGADGMLYGSYEMTRPDVARCGFDTLQKAFLRSRANSIEGGTTEVMRNILGERVLGLPGDVRVDRDRPLERGPAQLTA